MTGDYSTGQQQWQASRPGPKFLVCQAGSQLLKLQGAHLKVILFCFLSICSQACGAALRAGRKLETAAGKQGELEEDRARRIQHRKAKGKLPGKQGCVPRFFCARCTLNTVGIF